jgi:hypothetical protein
MKTQVFTILVICCVVIHQAFAAEWKELIVRATGVPHKIKQLNSWDSPDAIQLAQSLETISGQLGKEWEGLGELAKQLREAIERGELQKEDIVRSRDVIADAVDLSIGACLQYEMATVLRSATKTIFNMDWDGLLNHAKRMKEIASLMPERLADIKPQSYSKAIASSVMFEKIAQALPAIMQTDVQKVLEGKQILAEAQEIAEKNQDDSLDALFQMFFIQAELKSDADLDETERARLQAQYQNLRSVQSSISEDSPGFNISKSSNILMNASKYITDGTNSLWIADLDEARQSMDKAEKLLDSAELALQEGDDKNVMASSIGQIVEGYQALVAAQRAYVVALDASIMGTLQSEHVNALKTSDQDLFKYGEPVKQALLVVGVTPEIANSNKRLFENQRTANRNLRRLAETALSPTNLSRIATGMFLVYFVVTLVSITAVMRFSGTMKSLKPPTMLLLVVTSFAAALIAAFGYQALKFLPLLKLLSGN